MKEPIKIEKDHNKKDDKISKNFINEIGFTRKPEEKKFNNSNSYKESNNNNINLNIISKSKKENVPQIMNINIDSQANPFERALSSGKLQENKVNINQYSNFNDNRKNNNNFNDNTTEDFQIFSSNNNDIINQYIDKSINKVENVEKNFNVFEDKNKDDIKHFNIINKFKGLEEKNDNNLNINSSNNIFANINTYNNKVLKQYKNTKTLMGHKDQIVSLIQLSSGNICTGSYDLSIKIWDISKDPKKALVTTKCSIGFVLCLLELKPNELLAGNSGNCIDIFNLADKKSVEPDYRLFGHFLWITALVKCDENHFASASNDAKIFIWDSNKKNKLKELLGHKDCILTMILLENGNLCSGSADKTIRIWDWKNEKCLSCKKAHNDWVKSIYQLNSQILLSGSDDRKIKIWNLNLGLLGNSKVIKIL